MVRILFVFVLGLAVTVKVANAQESCPPSVACTPEPALHRTCCQVTGPVAEHPTECRPPEVICKDDAGDANRQATERMNAWRAEAVAHEASARNARLEAELALCRPENCHDYHLGAVDNNRRPTQEECRLLQGRWEGERCNMCNSPLYLARERNRAMEERRVLKQARPDACLNLDGYQRRVPRGYVLENGNCVRPPPPPPTPREFTLTIVKAGDGDGATDPVEGEHQYREGTRVQLNASPNDSSTFEGWSGDRDCRDGEVRMTRNHSCTATFALIPPPPPPPVPEVDLCPNIEGAQTSIPDGHELDSAGNCVCPPPPEPPPPPPPPPVPSPPTCDEIRACGQVDLARIRVRTRQALRMAKIGLRTVHAGVFAGGYLYEDPIMRTSGVLGGVDLRLRLYKNVGVYAYGFGVALSNSLGAGAGVYGQISLSPSAAFELRVGGEWAVLDLHTGERRTRTPTAEVAGPTATALFQLRVSSVMALRAGVRAGLLFREDEGPLRGSDGVTLQAFIGPEFGIF